MNNTRLQAQIDSLTSQLVQSQARSVAAADLLRRMKDQVGHTSKLGLAVDAWLNPAAPIAQVDEALKPGTPDDRHYPFGDMPFVQEA
jgi:hypothetical protein